MVHPITLDTGPDGDHAVGMTNTKTTLAKAAFEIMGESGFEAVSAESVSRRAGITEAEFDQVFGSRESLLEAVFEWVSEQMLTPIRKVVEDPDLAALGKLNLLTQISSDYKAKHMAPLMALMSQLDLEEMAAVKARVAQHSQDEVTPLYRAIIAQGRSDGVFDVPDPDAAAEMIMMLATGMRHANIQTASIETIEKRMRSWLWAVERMLGVSAGSLDEPDPAVIRRFDEERARLA